MQYKPKHNPESHKVRQDMFESEGRKKAKKKRTVMTITIIVIAIVIGAIGYTMLRPGKYDGFAKCLTEKGAVMYGEDWCHNTQGQKAMFGNSFKYIDYVVKPDLKVRPTWVIDGKSYETVQSFQRLAALTGCKY